MIPREILKKIRQIELRTNRLVTGLGERARLGRSQRRPRRWHERMGTSRTFPAVITRVVRREGASNGSRGGCAPQISLSPAQQVVGEYLLVFWSALTCVLSPRRGFQAAALPAGLAGNPANPVTGISQDAAGVSPSRSVFASLRRDSISTAPKRSAGGWGEGRDEKTQNCLNLTTGRLPRLNSLNSVTCNHSAEPGTRLADAAATCADDRDAFADDWATRADDAAIRAEDWDGLAGNAATFADDRNAGADDRVDLADGAATRANPPAMFADDRVEFANPADCFADGRAVVADEPAFFAGSRANSRRRQIHFSTP
jgi:hypothetical protein